MARLITGAQAPTGTVALTRTDRRRAQRTLERAAAGNPLRRIRLSCDDTSTRDANAVVADHVWCEKHADFGRVESVVE